MAELNVGTLSMEIQVDGRAAIMEIANVRAAAEGSAEQLEDAYDDAAKAAGRAADDTEEAARRIGDSGEDAADKVKKGVEAAGKAVENTTQKTTKSLEDALNKAEKAGQTMTTWATAPLTALYGAMTKSASDLTETVSKTREVFKGSSDSVIAWSETSIEQMGLAQGSALDMASTFGDIGTSMGLNIEQATEMSTSLTQLSADLASFKNISADRAAQALTGVYTGETEALKSLGVVMTQANLQAFALSQGITTQVSAMTQAQQVQLRYAYVMQQTANAQGDFVRTGGNLANQSRALLETLKQTGTEFGEILQPAVTSAVSALREAALWMGNLDEGTKTTLLSIGGAVAAIGPFTLVVTKAGKALMAMKAAMSAASFGPIALAVTALTSLVGVGLYSALSKANKEIDTTTDEYQRMRAVLAERINAKVDVDTTDIDNLDGKRVTITIDGNGEEALNEAQAVIDELQTDEYVGKLTIDGDPQKAQDALNGLEEAVQAMLSGDGSVAELQAAVNACEELVISPEVDEETRAIVQSKLNELKATLGDLKSVSVTYSINQADDSDEARWDEFHAKVEAMGWEKKTFVAEGKFDIEPQTTEAVEEYAQALAAAATATSDYGTAVENLNSLLEQQLRQQMEQIDAQVAEKTEMLVAAYNKGYISEEDFYEQLESIDDAAISAKTAIDDQIEAQKELNGLLADGSAANDVETHGQIAMRLHPDATLGEEEFGGMIATLEEARAAGEDLTQYQLDARIALGMLKDDTVENYQEMIDAQQKYRDAVAGADEQERAEVGMNQEMAEEARRMQDALGEYLVALDMYNDDAESAIDEAASVLAENAADYESLKQSLTEILTNPETGELVGEDVSGAAKELENLEKTAEEAIEAARTKAQTARETALKEFQGTMETLSGEFVNAQANNILALIEQTGVVISESDAELVGATTGLIDNVAATLSAGNATVAAEVSTLLDAVGDKTSEASAEGQSIGAAITAGITAGLNTGTGALYVQMGKIVKRTIREAKNNAGIASPSRVMRDEVGKMLVQGVTVGVQQETPTAVQAIRRSMDGIMSGAAAVVNHGSYTVPAVQAAAAGFDYARMGAAMSEAVGGLTLRFDVDGRTLAQAQRENTARQQALRAHEINMGRGRVE